MKPTNVTYMTIAAITAVMAAPVIAETGSAGTSGGRAGVGVNAGVHTGTRTGNSMNSELGVGVGADASVAPAAGRGTGVIDDTRRSGSSSYSTQTDSKARLNTTGRGGATTRDGGVSSGIYDDATGGVSGTRR